MLRPGARPAHRVRPWLGVRLVVCPEGDCAGVHLGCRTHDGDNLEDSAARTRGNANTSLGCIRWEEQRGQGGAPPRYVALHERTYNVMRLRGQAYDGHAVAGVGAEEDRVVK